MIEHNDPTLPSRLRWIPEVHHAHRDPWLCHEPFSEPPLLPADVRVHARLMPASDEILSSADGARFRAHVSPASGGGDAGIVIAPDVRGLHSFYKTLADRFASAGIHAIAFDYFGRTYGTEVPPDAFYAGSYQQEPYPPFREHVAKTQPAQIQEDLRAASAKLRQATGARRVFVTGFCFGGRVAFNAAADQPDVSGVIGFYGQVKQRDAGDTDSPMVKIDKVRAPIMGLFGGADQGITQADTDAYDKALAAKGIKHKIVRYEGAPHSFFDRTFDQHKAACDDAWRRMLAFMKSGDPESI